MAGRIRAKLGGKGPKFRRRSDGLDRQSAGTLEAELLEAGFRGDLGGAIRPLQRRLNGRDQAISVRGTFPAAARCYRLCVATWDDSHNVRAMLLASSQQASAVFFAEAIPS